MLKYQGIGNSDRSMEVFGIEVAIYLNDRKKRDVGVI